MNHWKHAKKYGVLIVLICAALCFWLSQAQGAEMGSFSGKVFEDLNNDGIMDENDPGVAGVTLEFVRKDLESGDIRLLKTDFTIPERSVDMCTLKEVPPTAAATAFMEMVRRGM